MCGKSHNSMDGIMVNYSIWHKIWTENLNEMSMLSFDLLLDAVCIELSCVCVCLLVYRRWHRAIERDGERKKEPLWYRTGRKAAEHFCCHLKPYLTTIDRLQIYLWQPMWISNRWFQPSKMLIACSRSLHTHVIFVCVCVQKQRHDVQICIYVSIKIWWF